LESQAAERGDAEQVVLRKNKNKVSPQGGGAKNLAGRLTLVPQDTRTMGHQKRPEQKNEQNYLY
jgi:hypothetical protein